MTSKMGGVSQLETDELQDGVKQWLQLGGRHLDSANDYGTEPDVGQAIKARNAGEFPEEFGGSQPCGSLFSGSAAPFFLFFGWLHD